MIQHNRSLHAAFRSRTTLKHMEQATTVTTSAIPKTRPPSVVKVSPYREALDLKAHSTKQNTTILQHKTVQRTGVHWLENRRNRRGYIPWVKTRVARLVVCKILAYASNSHPNNASQCSIDGATVSEIFLPVTIFPADGRQVETCFVPRRNEGKGVLSRRVFNSMHSNA